MTDTENAGSRGQKADADQGSLERRRALTHIGAAVGGGAAALAGLNLLGSEPASAGTLNGPNILNGPNTLDGSSQANTLKGTNLLQGTSGLGNVLSGHNTFADVNSFTGDAYFGSGRPWYDVRAFGAKGDGVTDDLASINAAIAALAGTGGVLLFPPGKYLVSNTIVFSAISNFAVEMAGAQILSSIHVSGQTSSYVSFDGCADFLVSGGIIGSSFTPVTRGICPAIQINSCNRFSFTGTQVSQGEGAGFYTTGATSHGSFTNCTVQNTKADGFDLFSSADGGPSQITYHGCRALNTGDDAFEVVSYSGQPVITDVTFVGNTVMQGHARGIVLAGAKHVTVLGNVISQVAAAGLTISCDTFAGTQGVSEAVIAGNVIDQSGSPDASALWASVDISGNGGASSVTDVLCIDNLFTNVRWRGIQVAGPPMSRVRVAGNRITGAASIGIKVAGTQDIEISDNGIYDSGDQGIVVDSKCVAPISVRDNRIVNASTSRTGNQVALDMEGVFGARAMNNEVLDPNANLQAGIDLTGAQAVVLAGNSLGGTSVRPAATYAPAAGGSPLQLGAEPQAGATIYTGRGVPTFPANAGDLYVRIDTPSTAQQRLYMCTAGSTWSGIA